MADSSDVATDKPVQVKLVLLGESKIFHWREYRVEKDWGSTRAWR